MAIVLIILWDWSQVNHIFTIFRFIIWKRLFWLFTRQNNKARIECFGRLRCWRVSHLLTISTQWWNKTNLLRLILGKGQSRWLDPSRRREWNTDTTSHRSKHVIISYFPSKAASYFASQRWFGSERCNWATFLQILSTRIKVRFI